MSRETDLPSLKRLRCADGEEVEIPRRGRRKMARWSQGPMQDLADAEVVDVPFPSEIVRRWVDGVLTIDGAADPDDAEDTANVSDFFDQDSLYKPAAVLIAQSILEITSIRDWPAERARRAIHAVATAPPVFARKAMRQIRYPMGVLARIALELVNAMARAALVLGGAYWDDMDRAFPGVKAAVDVMRAEPRAYRREEYRDPLVEAVTLALVDLQLDAETGAPGTRLGEKGYVGGAGVLVIDRPKEWAKGPKRDNPEAGGWWRLGYVGGQDGLDLRPLTRLRYLQITSPLLQITRPERSAKYVRPNIRGVHITRSFKGSTCRDILDGAEDLKYVALRGPATEKPELSKHTNLLALSIRDNPSALNDVLPFAKLRFLCVSGVFDTRASTEVTAGQIGTLVNAMPHLELFRQSGAKRENVHGANAAIAFKNAFGSGSASVRGWDLCDFRDEAGGHLRDGDATDGLGSVEDMCAFADNDRDDA